MEYLTTNNFPNNGLLTITKFYIPRIKKKKKKKNGRRNPKNLEFLINQIVK